VLTAPSRIDRPKRKSFVRQMHSKFFILFLCLTYVTLVSADDSQCAALCNLHCASGVTNCNINWSAGTCTCTPNGTGWALIVIFGILLPIGLCIACCICCACCPFYRGRRVQPQSTTYVAFQNQQPPQGYAPQQQYVPQQQQFQGGGGFTG